MAEPGSLERVESEALACTRGGRLVFRDLSFSLGRSELLSLEGPNGAGKTSALRLIAGLLAAAGGAVRFSAREGDTVADPEERARYVGWLGHQDGIKAQLTVVENARFSAALYRSGADIGTTLERVGLGTITDLPAQYLSAGQRRRLGLARLLLSERPLWLLDEPLASLDAAGKKLVAELIDLHRRAGGIAIAATHEPLGLPGARLIMGQ